jgi:putative membrane protein
LDDLGGESNVGGRTPLHQRPCAKAQACDIRVWHCLRGIGMSFILSWLILSFAVWVTDALLPGFHVKSAKSALLVAAIFGVLNFLLGWLLFAIFTVATLGLAWLLAFITRWIINAILLVLTDKLTDHLKIDSFGWALGGALSMSLIGTLGEWVVRSIF